jgi:hypothetical protein
MDRPQTKRFDMTSHDSDITLDRCLRAVWRRTQGRHTTAALLALARWFVPLVLGVILIDWLTDLPNWLRAIAALGVLGVSLRQAWRHGGADLQRFDATRTAQQIEHAQGGMESVLVTAVQFQQRGASPGTSAAMWELAARQAQEAAGNVAPRDVVSMDALKRPLVVALGLAAVLVTIAILHRGILAAGFGRVFTPWLAIAYPTDTQIDLGSDEMVVQEGSPATITIRLSGEVPKTAALSLQTGEGRPRELDLEVVDGVCTYELAAASRDFSYRVRAGDARSAWRPVRVIPAPRMAKVAVTLDFPDYMERPDETVEALTLTVPEETSVRWQLTLDTPIRKATLHRDDAEDVPLEVGSDGRTITLSEAATASRGYSFSWTEDRHGFHFTSPRYFLQVASDQPPRIELTAPVSNLNALIGRPLELAARAQDDHGIGATRIIYRVNRRPEKTVELPAPLPRGEGELPLDWDYRTELPDLAVGDSVSFLVEVADRYPGDGGPHRARSETRRITFLSREDYLAEVNKQMERLLNRVRTLYRQERAAHDLTVGLDPTSESFVATCQLEAIRQEMVREQLVTTAADVQALLDDLAANQVTDAVEADSLAAVRDALRAIASDHVAQAADLLRAQVGAATRDPLLAAAAVNQAARELAALVLLRGIDASREVFARETQMLAGALARLRLRFIKAVPDQIDASAKGLEEVATWTDELFHQLSAGMRYDKRPLAVLGLSRRIHDLRAAKVTEALRGVAAKAREGKPATAAADVYPLIRPLLEAEFTMRSGAEYAVIRTLREQLAAWIAGQEQVLADGQAAEDFAKQSAALATRQAALRDALVLAAMPGIPAPRARLLDLTYPPIPPGNERRLEAEALMTEALAHLQAHAKDEALASQQEALAALRELDQIVGRWSVELAQMTLGVSTQVSDTSDRIGVLEGFENRLIGLVEQTEEVALDEKDPAALIEDLEALAEEVDAFRQELSGGQRVVDGVPLLLGRIAAASKAMSHAVTALHGKQVEDAIEPEAQAAAALAEARGIAQGQLVKFTLQQQLIGFQQAVTNASSGMVDLIGGQKDLTAATATADEKELETLLAPQRNLHQCLTDIAPALDVVASRLDVGTPLVFAASDIDDAIIAMEDGEAEEAAEIQETAIESLGKVQRLVAEVAVQTGYVTEIVEALHGFQSDGSLLAFRQREIREQGKPEEALAEQKALATDAAAYGVALTTVTGRIDFQVLDEKVRLKFEGLQLTLDGMAPATHMAEAGRLLEAGKPADEAMQAAEATFGSQAEQLNVVIAMLNGLPSIVLSKAEPPELHRLIAVLDIASKQRVLLRQIFAAADKELPALAAAQQALADAIAKANEPEELRHPLLAKAHEQMAPVAAMLRASSKATAEAAQLAADQTLRHFIIEQALILNTAVPPASSSDSDVVTEAETDDLYYTESVGFVSDFVSGEAPKDKKSEWEILGERNRAALNQNFARELPLEYRATLKNYYERVAK